MGWFACLATVWWCALFAHFQAYGQLLHKIPQLFSAGFNFGLNSNLTSLKNILR